MAKVKPKTERAKVVDLMARTVEKQNGHDPGCSGCRYTASGALSNMTRSGLLVTLKPRKAPKNG